jgi:6-pyruvoyltetrahydropterin/6-carboxytetrahydropterin synthase
MITLVTKEFKFEAAHQLPNHSGKCANLHGHTYKCVLYLSGMPKEQPGKSDDGFVIDFGIISQLWKAHVEPMLDHQFLNDTVQVRRTTAELMAQWLLVVITELVHAYDSTVQVVAVRLWETETGSAIVIADGFDNYIIL